ncbi:hypothetical protein jhhlp_006818 [Lomentospora prolificans]|uniref:Sialidase n=1 Tax=Lomentospora prolificans TaxID=41688 RepID=A0A2N3N2V3_9PEZI|nr:hypothetical protein jhhlp_006818 [Lomentospora prolificans]
MSTLAADMAFNFNFSSCESPVQAPEFSFDSSFLQMPYNPGHARSSSRGSVYSVVSAVSTPDSVSTRMTTPPRASPPIRHHGPILLPKIRSQDQTIDASSATQAPAKKLRASTSPCPPKPARKSHMRSYTNPDTLNFHMPFVAQPEEQQTSLLCQPAPFVAQLQDQTRRASSCGVENNVIDRFGFPTYRQMPTYMPAASQTPPPETGYMYAAAPVEAYASRDTSPLAFSAEPTPTTTLMSYLTASNPAPSLVRTISYHHRDPNTKHFWWDVRQVRPWTTFNASTILSIPGADAVLSCPVALPLLPTPPTLSNRHPETEAALHSIYASYYLPKLNSALAVSSTRPLMLSVPPKPSSSSAVSDHLFIATGPGESASAAAIFGGKPTARVVGLVRSFDRFNTGMRVEGNIKRVEYLRGLAALHHAMREHSCRYGFILTEIELVIVRNGTDNTPHFGYLEVTSIQLANASPPSTSSDTLDAASLENGEVPLTACLALWGLCMLASGEQLPAGHAHWKSEIGAPAEGTRRKALPRDDWMPQPQLAEKREAKRARGWVLPEDPVGRKELGKRGVRYSAC